MLNSINYRQSITSWLALIIIGFMFWNLLTDALNRPVSFDGAMNLQVAAALSEGNGYARFYTYWRQFPIEVQTNAPLVLPAALVYSVSGVSHISSQVVSIGYLIALLLLSGLLAYRFFGTSTALLAVAAIILLPKLGTLGLGGYGEIPALFWLMAAISTFVWRRDDLPSLRSCIAIGTCLALACMTKTVMLMPVLVIAALMLTALLLQRRMRAILLLGAGFLFLIITQEVWRIMSLGGIEPWVAWWNPQLDSITSQAGIRQHFTDTSGFLNKITTHADILAHSLSLPVTVLWSFICILASVAATAIANRSLPSMLRWMLLMLCVCVLVYLCWWLAITPTQKAWYRRIIIGVILAVFLSGCLIGVSVTYWRQLKASRWLLPLPILLISMSLAQQFQINTRDNAELVSLRHATAIIKSLDSGIPLTGIGWYSNPVLALYSGRHFSDFNAIRYFSSQPYAYLVEDRNMRRSGEARKTLELFPHQVIFQQVPWLSIYRLDLSESSYSRHPINEDQLHSLIDFEQSDYPFVYGFLPAGASTWRWATPYIGIDLRYAADKPFIVELFMHELSRYYFNSENQNIDGQLTITLSIPGCTDQTLTLNERGRHTLTFALDCTIADNSPIRAQLRSNAVLRDSNNSMSYIVYKAGFMPPRSNPSHP